MLNVPPASRLRLPICSSDNTLALMRTILKHLTAFLISLLCGSLGFCANQTAAPLPPGVEAVWDLNKASRDTTPTRERICINGLWRWQPVDAQAQDVPTKDWGYFKVPGCWPGITDYMQKDS